MNTATTSERWTPAGTSAHGSGFGGATDAHPEDRAAADQTHLDGLLEPLTATATALGRVVLALLGVKDLRSAEATADAVIVSAERAADDAADKRFQAWLDSQTAVKGDRFTQLQLLGGMRVARAAFRASAVVT